MSMAGTNFSHGPTSISRRPGTKVNRAPRVKREGGFKRNVIRALLDGKVTYREAVHKLGYDKRKAHRKGCYFDPMSSLGVSQHTKSTTARR